MNVSNTKKLDTLRQNEGDEYDRDSDLIIIHCIYTKVLYSLLHKYI